MLKVLSLNFLAYIRVFLYAACSLILPNAHAATANIIDTTYGAGAGGFELGIFKPTYTNPTGLVAGDTNISGWIVGDGGVAWVNGWNPNQTGTLAPFYAVDSGAYAVNLQNTSNGSISTVIPTITGSVYKLTFGAAGPPSYFFGAYGDIGIGVVSAGSLVNQVFTGEYSNQPYYTEWQTFTPFEFMFTALGSTTTIQFTGQNPGVGPYHYGPLIDSVNVTAVPISSAVWLFGSALTAFIGVCRRKRF